jgi:general secretion pathway protein K
MATIFFHGYPCLFQGAKLIEVMARQSLIHNNRGIALIITLMVITLLVAVTFELNRQMRAAVTDSAISRDRLTLMHMISSGASVAQAVLIQDKNTTEIDSIQENWADPEKLNEYISQLPFDEGEVVIYISDELSRIQVNALVAYPQGKEFNAAQRDLWYRFIAMLLTQVEEEDNFMQEIIEPNAIINPIKDWLDFDDGDAITGLNGAENDYYRALDPPYGCRNGPIRHIEELMRIKGITPELFMHLDEEVSGISQFVTVHGAVAAEAKFKFPGNININTAELPVVAALLPPEFMFLAPEICDFRIEKTDDLYVNDLSSPTWYKNVPGCAEIEISEELITVKSDLFRIECMARLNDMFMSATLIVSREKDEETGKWFCRVLQWTLD